MQAQESTGCDRTRGEAQGHETRVYNEGSRPRRSRKWTHLCSLEWTHEVRGHE